MQQGSVGSASLQFDLSKLGTAGGRGSDCWALPLAGGSGDSEGAAFNHRGIRMRRALGIVLFKNNVRIHVSAVAPAKTLLPIDN